MKLLIVFLAILVISVSSENKENTTDSKDSSSDGQKSEETLEDMIKQFEDRAQKTNEAIVNNTKDVIELAQDTIENVMNKAVSDAKSFLKNGETIVEKYNEIKSKVEQSLLECKDKFLGETSVLGHLNGLKKGLEELVTEIKKCPIDNINGMGCTLGKVMRGEAIREEAINLIENEKDTAEKRAQILGNWIESCYEKAVSAAKEAIADFMDDIKKCNEKDEL